MNGLQCIKKDILAICILIPVLVGSIAAFITRNSMDLYNTIHVPPFAPPAYLFPIVWLMLYITMGISSYLIYVSGSSRTNRALLIYALQLALNFGWSLIFFNLRAFLAAFVWLVVLWFTILWMILEFSKINKISALIQIPYLLWVLFAGVLNFSIYILN